MEGQNINQIKTFLWIWGVLAFASLVSLVGKVLDFMSTDSLWHRIALPGILFIISAIGLSINRKAYSRLVKELPPPDNPALEEGQEPDDQSQDDQQ